MLSRYGWTLLVLILLLSGFASRTFGSWTTVSVLFLLSLLVVAAKRIRRVSAATRLRRLLAFLSGTLLVALVSLARLVPYLSQQSVNPLILGADLLCHAALTVILFIWSIRNAAGHPIMLGLGLVVVMMCSIAGGVSLTINSQITVAFCACIGYLLASQIILGTRFEDRRNSSTGTGRHDGREAPAKQRWNRASLLLSTLTVSAILICTGFLGQATGRSIGDIQKAVHASLKDSLDQAIDQLAVSGTRYVYGAKFGSIRNTILSNPDEIALRVWADSAPGYMRGNAFDYYDHRAWHTLSGRQSERGWGSPSLEDVPLQADGLGTTALQSRSPMALQRFRFFRQTSRKVATTIEVRNVPLKGTTIFMPLSTQWIEASSSGITLTQQQTVLHGVNVMAPYVLGVADAPSPDILEAPREQSLLFVPAAENEVFEPLAKQICGNAGTALQKAGRIEQFFQQNFSYSLELPERPANKDPLAYFIESRHQAHCEYFASATCLLLRCVGVPSRYVTGYVADQREPDDRYWIAQNRDAHAWAEAYDADSQTWFSVESTPGRRYQTIGSGESLDSLNSGNGQDDLDINASGRNWILAFFTILRTNNPLGFLFQLAQAPLFLLICFVFWRRYRHRQGSFDSEDDRYSNKLLRRMDRRMRRFSFVRENSETMHQFAERMQLRHATEPDDTRVWIEGAADWYRKFAEARYQGNRPKAP